MMKSLISFARRWLEALARSRSGASAVEYVMVAGLVGVVALPAFAQFDSKTLTAVQDRSSLVAHLGGEATGPVDSLGGEIAGATVNNAASAVKDGTAFLDLAPFVPFGGLMKKSHGEEDESHASPDGERGPPEPGAPPDSPGGAPIAFDEPPSREPPSGPEGRCANGVCVPGNPTGCFVAGTPVLTPGGLKAIEQIQPDDEVVSRNEDTGEVSVRRVVQTFVRLNAAVVRVDTLDADDRAVSIEATPGHLFWTAGGWVRADELEQGEHLLDAHDGVVRVARVEAEGATATVYNFEVDVTHTYFVGADAVWVHNMAGGPSTAASVLPPVAGASTQTTDTQAVRQANATLGWRAGRPANDNNYRQVAFPLGNGDLSIACLGDDCVIVDLGINTAFGTANTKGHPYKVNTDGAEKVDFNALASDIKTFIGHASNVSIVFTHPDDDHTDQKVIETLLKPPAGVLAGKVRQIIFGAEYAGYRDNLKSFVENYPDELKNFVDNNRNNPEALKNFTTVGSGDGTEPHIINDPTNIPLDNRARPLNPNCSGYCLSLNFLANNANPKAKRPNDKGLVIAVGIVSVKQPAANDNGKGKAPADMANTPAVNGDEPAENDNGGRIFTAVFTGDGGEESLKAANKTLGPGAKVDVLDTPHHGSADKTHKVPSNMAPTVMLTSASSDPKNIYRFPREGAVNLGIAMTKGTVDSHGYVTRVGKKRVPKLPKVKLPKLPKLAKISLSKLPKLTLPLRPFRPEKSSAPEETPPVTENAPEETPPVTENAPEETPAQTENAPEETRQTKKAWFVTGEGPVEIRFDPDTGELQVAYGNDGNLRTNPVTTSGGDAPPPDDPRPGDKRPRPASALVQMPDTKRPRPPSTSACM